jgi:hypothetical protein
MARIKITPNTIQAKLNKWAQGQETLDELIYFQNEIQPEEWKQKAWDLANMIIDTQADTVTGFNKIVFIEKL